MRRKDIFALAWLLGAGGAFAAGAEPPWRQEMIWRLRVDERLTRLLNVCPADVAGSRWPHAASRAGSSAEDCQRNPLACYERCGAGDAQACFHVALALELEAPPMPSQYWKSLYSAACELGEAGGCTNRAASLRNLDDPDPLNHISEPAARCEFRSFRYACEKDDAWGCAMLGQALMNGEGVAANPQEARAALRKSCDIDPDFEACDFAKKIEPPRQGAPEIVGASRPR